jgi:hypothetical protein
MLGLLARASAPFISVVAGLLWLQSAWLTVVLYHVQMLFWSHRELRRLCRGWNPLEALAMVIPAAMSGPLTYVLLPHMVSVPLREWLTGVNLQGPAFVLFVFYYGLVHPLLEQAHWGGIRRDGRLGVGAHVAFATYHGLVLQAFMRSEWAILCVVILAGSSVAWHRLDTRSGGGLAIPALSHLLADFGLVLAVWARL